MDPTVTSDVAFVDDEDGRDADIWHYEDSVIPIPLISAAAGYEIDELTTDPITYDEMRPGCYRPADRLADMDIAGIEASACFPNTLVRFCGLRFLHAKDKDLALLCVQAYNDFQIDEWGGGSSPRCRDTDRPEWGADAIFDIVDGKMAFRSYYKLPVPQTAQENCVAHNGSLVPVPGRDVMVQAWYQGGLSVVDFTDSANPVELAYYDRGPIDSPNPTSLNLGGYWSTYWYDGHVFGSEIARGFDALALTQRPALGQRDRRCGRSGRRGVQRPAPDAAALGPELQRGRFLPRPGGPRGRPVRRDPGGRHRELRHRP